MLQIVNSTDGKLKYLTPHAFHTIEDRSAVPAPQISYNGVGMFMPIYAEKGPDNTVLKFEGPSAYSRLLDTFGRPDAKKYGLAYSAVEEHASLGGYVYALSLKAPSAKHSALILNLKLQREDTKQVLGWVYTGKLKDVSIIVEGETKVKSVAEDFADFINGIQPTDVKEKVFNSVPAFSNQVIRNDNLRETDTTPILSKDKPGIKFENDEANTNFKSVWESYVSKWKPIEMNPLRMSFEAVDIDALTADVKAHPKKYSFSGFNGVTSWEALESGVKNARKGDRIEFLSDIKTRKEETNKITFEVPILWGVVEGRGVYGNRYKLEFSSTNGNVEGRPVLKTRLIDTKDGIIVPNSSKNVSFSNDFVQSTIPLLIDTAYSKDAFPESPIKLATASLDTFDEIGEIVQESFKKLLPYADNKITVMIDGTATPVNPLFATGYGAIGDLLINEMKQLLAKFEESEDSSFHRLSKLDLTRVTDTIGFQNSGGLLSYSFAFGDEGEFKFMKEFDWDFNFGKRYKDGKLYAKYYETNAEFKEYADRHGDEKIVSRMFREAFEGKVDQKIDSLHSNRAKFIVDIGFPLEVKQAMFNFGSKRRDDIQMLFNAPISNASVREMIEYKNKNNNIQGRNVYWFPGNFEWIDKFSSRAVRVPDTFVMIPIINKHYENGYSKSLAGVTRGYVANVKSSTGRAHGNFSLEENQMLYKAGYNIFSTHQDDRLYLDSQLANYNLNEVSSLNEFHNNSIINEILKLIYERVQLYKHIITSEQSASMVQEIINKELAPFVSKVASFSYSCFYESAYNKAIGELTHSIQIEFFNTTKYHKIHLVALPISGN